MAYVTVDAGEFSYQVWVDDPVPPATNPQVPPPPPPPPSPASDSTNAPVSVADPAVAAAAREAQIAESTSNLIQNGYFLTSTEVAARVDANIAERARAADALAAFRAANAVPDPNLIPLPAGITQFQIDEFQAWQASQFNPFGQGFIGNIWSNQGIVDPATNNILRQQAIDQIERAQDREDFFKQAGVPFNANLIEPWANPNWRYIQGAERQAEAERQQRLAEQDRLSGVVVGGGIVNPNNSGSSASPVTGSQYNATSTTYVTNSVATTQSRLLNDTSVAIGTRLTNFIRANPSNAIRRRSALPLVPPAVEQANANTVANLSAASTQTSTAAQAAAAPGVPVVTTVTNTASGESTVTSVAAATNQPVDYITDATLTVPTEIAIGTFTAPLANTTAVTDATGTAVPPTAIVAVPVAQRPTSSDPLSNIALVGTGLAAAAALFSSNANTARNTTVADTAGIPVPEVGENFDVRRMPDGTYEVINLDTNDVLASGLSEAFANSQAAALRAAAIAIRQGPTINESSTVQNVTAGNPTSGPRYSASITGEDGTWGVFDNQTGQFITTGRSEAEAVEGARNLNELEDSRPEFNDQDPEATEQNVVTILAQKQAVLQAQTVFANNGDWRVKLSLAEGAQYLYNDPDVSNSQSSVLWPLKQSRGVIFPYTPQIDTSYKADYDSYNLTHSNYRGYFYKGSSVEPVTISAMFTAQDTFEANYLLAVIHFFRSVTKMFYGQDAQRGVPPPLVFLTGLGSYQFNGHPCVVSNFQYSLPNNVDYIRAKTANVNGSNLLNRRDRQSQSNNPVSSAVTRLQNLFSSQGVTKGATFGYKPQYTVGKDSPTYVPTKMDMTITLLPIQSRTDVSKVFSLKDYATGNLLRRGFW